MLPVSDVRCAVRWWWWARTVVLGTARAALEPPVLSLESISANVASFTWTTSNGASGDHHAERFRLYYGEQTADRFFPPAPMTLNGHRGALPVLQPATAYVVCVKALAADGTESQCSNTVAVTTLAASGTAVGSVFAF